MRNVESLCEQLCDAMALNRSDDPNYQWELRRDTSRGGKRLGEGYSRSWQVSKRQLYPAHCKLTVGGRTGNFFLMIVSTFAHVWIKSDQKGNPCWFPSILCVLRSGLRVASAFVVGIITIVRWFSLGFRIYFGL